MNPKTGIQIVAAFLVLTMVLSIFPMFLRGTSPNSQETAPDNIQNDYFNIQGKQVYHGFATITDALQMSTQDVREAQFVDVEYIMSNDFQPWNEYLPFNLTTTAALNKSQIDGLYLSSTNQMYIALISDDDFIILSTMSSKNVPLNYMPRVSNDGQYLILKRLDTGTYERYNVMGEPTIYTSSLDIMENILSIIESFIVPSTAYDTFKPVLNYSDDYSEYQVVNSNVDFADLYYLGIHKNKDGSFTRTTIYQNATEETSSHIRELAQSGIERGFTQYEIIEEEDIIKVTLSGEFALVINEDSN